MFSVLGQIDKRSIVSSRFEKFIIILLYQVCFVAMQIFETTIVHASWNRKTLVTLVKKSSWWKETDCNSLLRMLKPKNFMVLSKYLGSCKFLTSAIFYFTQTPGAPHQCCQRFFHKT